MLNKLKKETNFFKKKGKGTTERQREESHYEVECSHNNEVGLPRDPTGSPSSRITLWSHVALRKGDKSMSPLHSPVAGHGLSWARRFSLTEEPPVAQAESVHSWRRYLRGLPKTAVKSRGAKALLASFASWDSAFLIQR